MREVRRQLRPLEKQADAARRHAGVVAELTALRLYIAGRQIDELRTRLETAVTAKTELAREAEDLKGRLAHLDAEVTRAEAELSARGADDVGDDLVRFESLRERARGLAAVLKERARGIERERLSFTDQGVIFSLEADAATLRRELTDVAAEVERLTPELSSLAEVDQRAGGGPGRLRPPGRRHRHGQRRPGRRGAGRAGRPPGRHRA